MPIITFVDHTIPVAADFNDSYSFINTEVRTYERGGTGQSSYAKGDTLYASATNTVSKLAIAVYGSVLGVSSSGLPAWSRTLYRSGTDVNVLTTTETSLFLSGAITIAANTLGTANRLRITVRGTMGNTSGGAVTFTFRLKYGATTLLTSADSIATATSDKYPFTADLMADAATGAQIAAGAALFDTTTNTIFTGTAAEDSTAAKTLDVTMQLSSAVNASYIASYVMVEVLI